MVEQPTWVFQDILCEFWASNKVGEIQHGDPAITNVILNKSKKVLITLKKLKRAFDLEYIPDVIYEQYVSHSNQNSFTRHRIH